LAGYSLARETLLPNGQDLAQLSVFWLLLSAGLTNHAALSEQRGVKMRHERLLRALAKEIPILIMVVAGLGSYIYYDAHKDDIQFASLWFLPLVLASFPLGVLAFHRTLRWRDSKFLTFRSRSYFPALATCLPAFILGYYLQNGEILLLGAGILILSLWFFSLQFSLLATAIVQACMLLGAIVFMLFFPLSPIRVCIFGVFLTLAMGVSEAWRVTTRVVAGVQYRPTGAYTTDEQRLFLGGTNIATALFLPLFLTTYLHPRTEPLYLVFVTIALLTGYFLWFRYGGSRHYKAWTAVAFCFGISLPLILAFAARMKGEVALPWKLPLERLGAPITFMTFMATLGLAATMTTYMTMYVKKQSFVTYFIQKNNAIELTAVASTLLAYLGYLTTFGLGTMEKQGSQHDRLNWLTFIYIAFSLAAFIYVKAKRVAEAARV
jgi:hypothetical protein